MPWINVDKITSVEVKTNEASGEIVAQVWYGSSAAHLTLEKDEAKKLLAWLAANKAE